jgi:hypothetical protein
VGFYLSPVGLELAIYYVVILKMSLKFITNICDRGQGYHDFYQYCLSQLVPKMNLDVSRYARDRYRLWLINEPSLSGQLRLTPAYNDAYLNKVIQWLYPNCNTALISFHGRINNVCSNAQIEHHRDTSFASDTARLLNLGSVANFSYSDCRINNSSNACTNYLLDPGDLIEFHCKHLHACTYAAPGRISLVMWRLKPEYQKPMSN